VGYEKLFNPALQFTDEESFVQYILADQPEAPKYFALMKRVNKEGPMVLGAGHYHLMLDVAGLAEAIKAGTVIDLTPSPEFTKGHVAGTINIPIEMLSAWAGWLVDYDRPTYLICEPSRLEEAARLLHKIGVEHVAGAFDAIAVKASGKATEVYSSGTPTEIAKVIEAGDVKVIDVRSNDEWSDGHLKQAEHRFLGRLPRCLSEIPRHVKLVVHCQSGVRSAICDLRLQ
jgi:hydroxyacylglutathione hydrolase